MNNYIKKDALIQTAMAYYNRGGYVQYDQRSIDRILQLTPRRHKFLSPEAATESHTVFLDCSGFVNAIYYQTFGYELPSDLTWHMIDFVKPRIYYYELTHTETEEDIKTIENQIRNLLEPGDIITYDRGIGSGHTLMYTGNDKYIHCTTNGTPDSYDYINRKSREYEHGGIWIDNISNLFEKEYGEEVKKRSLFCRNNRRFSISRPLDIMGEITKNTSYRINEAKNLICGVNVSHPGLKCATAGEIITYSLFIKNQNDEPKNVKVNFISSEDTYYDGFSFKSITVEPYETVTLDFSVKAKEPDDFWINPPEVTVNGLNVYTPTVLFSKNNLKNETVNIINDIAALIKSGKTALGASSYVYGKYGIKIPADEQQNIYNCFYLHDSTNGDVLSRRPQNPATDNAVYSGFGGYGVVTPELASTYGIRITKIQTRDLMPGDIVLCSDDPYGIKIYSSFYTGDKLIGHFESDEKTYKILENDEINKFIDSLFGRFCFIILRPYI